MATQFRAAWVGGVLQIMGVPVGQALGQFAFQNDVSPERGNGSVIVVIATDAPLSDRNLERVAARAMMGLGRTGSSAANGSGDYAIAFSTAAEVRRPWNAKSLTTTELANEEVSAVFQAVVEATEEAVYNSLFMATTTTGNGRTINALPLDKVRALLEARGIPRQIDMEHVVATHLEIDAFARRIGTDQNAQRVLCRVRVETAFQLLTTD